VVRLSTGVWITYRNLQPVRALSETCCVERLFNELASRGCPTETQMIDSTHVKAHRSASRGKGRGKKSGNGVLAGRRQYEDPCNRGC
jgi:hypothetical protein